MARDNQVRLERNPLAERFPLLGALVGQRARDGSFLIEGERQRRVSGDRIVAVNHQRLGDARPLLGEHGQVFKPLHLPDVLIEDEVGTVHGNHATLHAPVIVVLLNAEAARPALDHLSSVPEGERHVKEVARPFGIVFPFRQGGRGERGRDHSVIARVKEDLSGHLAGRANRHCPIEVVLKGFIARNLSLATSHERANRP